eukprot:12979620-Alexandrium_andersonii.AAC.1
MPRGLRVQRKGKARGKHLLHQGPGGSRRRTKPWGVQGSASSQGTRGSRRHAEPWVAASAVQAGKH